MILVIDEDDMVRKGCKAALSFAGHQVTAVPSYPAAMEAVFASGGTLSCVVLGAGARGDVGLKWAASIRRGYPDLPIVMLAKSDAGAGMRLEALNSGVDDFVEKPIPAIELVHRVNALLRRGASVKGAVCVGNLHFDLKSRVLTVGMTPLVLAHSRHAVLEALLSRRGAVVSRAELMELSGAQSHGALEVLMSRLRRLLREKGACVRIAAACNAGYYIESSGEDLYEAAERLGTVVVAG